MIPRGIPPPRLAERLVRLSLPGGIASQTILGDLREEFDVLCGAASPRAARRWYWRHAVDVAGRFAWQRTREALRRPGRSGSDRRGRRRTMLEALRDDVRHAVRALRQSPAATALALTMLALGLGATTAIFAVVDAVLLRSLPYAEPERLVRVAHAHATRGAEPGAFSPQDFDDLRTATGSLDRVAAYWYAPGQSTVNLVAEPPPARVDVAYVSAEFFDTLGVGAAAGRTLLPDDVVRGRDGVAVVSHGLWATQLGADPGVIGRSVSIDRAPFTVLGVMPPQFAFPAPGVRLWLPISLIEDDDIPHLRGLRWMQVVARLRDGVDRVGAQTETSAILARLAQAHPDSNEGWDRAELDELRESLVGEVRPALLILFAATGLVLCLICANVGAVLLARATARQREIAIRVSLGASRARLLRQLLAESLLLAAIAGVTGLGVAIWGGDLLLALGAETMPRAQEIEPDLRLLGFAVAASLITGLLLGILPAIRSAGIEPARALADGAPESRGARPFGVFRPLVVGEVALAATLAIGAGLMLQSFARLVEVDPGFDAARVLRLAVSLRGEEFETSSERLVARQQELLDAIARVPGVVAVGGSKTAPLSGGGEPYSFTLKREDGSELEVRPESGTYIVTSGFFEALGITLHGGRVFGRHEPAPVVVVNAALAGRLWPGGDAVGKSLYLGTRAAEVIGVVGDVRHDGLARDARGALYIHASRAPRSNLNLFVRTARDPLSAAQEVRRAVWAVDPELPIAELAPLDRTLGDHVAQPRFFALLMLCFGVLALGLASLGLYGVISYAVGRRTREIGIRIALGATRRDVRRLVVTQAMSLAVAGLALGLLGAAWLGRGLSGLLFGIGPYDPTIFGGVSLLLLAVALAASYGPAHRATRVDPVDALRSS